MANNELLNKLKKIHKLKKEDIEAAFKKIAKEIFNNYLLKIKDNKYRITEIEFYYYDKCIHPDPYVHRDNRQQSCGEWYFHRYKESDKLKVGNYKGLDITFGNNSSFGGILIRAIEKQNEENDYTEGPCKVVNCILEIEKDDNEKYKQLVKEIEKTDIFENNKINKKISLIYLSYSEKKNDIVYKCPRKGLSIKSNLSSNWEKYIMKPYRYLLYPRKTTKERNLLALGLLHEKYNKDLNNAESIINKFGSVKITVANY